MTRKTSRLYFTVSDSTDRVQLDKIASTLGFIRERGQGAGQGDFGRVLDGIFTGDIVCVTENQVSMMGKIEHHEGYAAAIYQVERSNFLARLAYLFSGKPEELIEVEHYINWKE